MAVRFGVYGSMLFCVLVAKGCHHYHPIAPSNLVRTPEPISTPDGHSIIIEVLRSDGTPQAGVSVVVDCIRKSVFPQTKTALPDEYCNRVFRGYLTDAEGRMVIRDLLPGSYFLQLQCGPFVSSREVVLPEQGSRGFRFYMNPWEGKECPPPL